MKYVWFGILIIHGAIHYLGFAKSRQPNAIPALKKSISPQIGIIWLITALLLTICGVLILMEKSYWWKVTALGIILSQLLILSSWSDSSRGTFLNVIILFPIVLSAFAAKQVETNDKKHMTIPQNAMAEREVYQHFPESFERYMNFSGVKTDHYTPRTTKLQQRGTMRPYPRGPWLDFTAQQSIDAINHAFVWTAVVDLPLGLRLFGMDQFQNNSGKMQISAHGIFPLVRESGQHIDRGALIRYLAEMNWTPDQLLQSDVQIEPVSENVFTVSIPELDPTAKVSYHIDSNDRLYQITALRPLGSVQTIPWRIELDTANYFTFHGFQVARKAKIYWEMPEGENHWMNIEIVVD